MDLSTLSLSELKSLQSQVAVELTRREQEEKDRTLAEIQALVAERGYSLNDLLGAPAKGKDKRSKQQVPAKYRHPSDAQLVWTGRGRQPRWVVEYLSSGGSLDGLLIA